MHTSSEGMKGHNFIAKTQWLILSGNFMISGACFYFVVDDVRPVVTLGFIYFQLYILIKDVLYNERYFSCLL